MGMGERGVGRDVHVCHNREKINGNGTQVPCKCVYFITYIHVHVHVCTGQWNLDNSNLREPAYT